MALTDEQLKAMGLYAPAPDVSVSAPPSTAAPAMTPIPSAAPAAMPTLAPPASHEEGKALYQQLMPKITASQGSGPEYYRQRQEQLDFKQAHPWGDPISAHPGVAGKILHGLSVAGNIAGNIVAPGTMALIPGTELHNRELEAQNERGITQGFANQEKEATAAKTTADTDEAKARTALTHKQTEELGQPKPKEEKWSEFTGWTDTDGTPLMREENSGQVVRAIDKKAPVGFKQSAAKNERPDTPEQQFIDEYQNKHKGATVAQALAAYTSATQKPEHDQRQLIVTPDGTVMEARPGMKIPQGSKTISGDLAGAKPSADEQRRADLAENLNENLNTLEDIVSRRPELFGPLAGRWSELKGKFGSNDADIAALQVLEHQIGMAQISAHGMRSAHGIEGAAQSIFNGLHSGPAALKSAIATVRNSVKTFQNDVEGKRGGEKKESSSGSAEPSRPANVPSGYTYKKNGPKGEGWYKP
jgi:hypothetical protein